ncbi:MAG: hypothetical protein ROZ64_15895 [Burkholderiaceae bacterium]|jgi:hypothetical protein|nr:hypothetical protein [Burkholderiaceae bacterium]
MTDDQLNELMALAAEGDSEAQQLIDSWIAQALAPLCATPPLPDEVTWLSWLDDEPECCPLCEERLAA